MSHQGSAASLGARNFAVVLICMCASTAALKLTPLNFDRVTDIAHEAKLVAAAYNVGRPVLDALEDRSSPAALEQVHKAIRRLHSSIERWIQAEGRLRSAVPEGNTAEAKKLDDGIHLVARTRALLGQLYMRANQDMLAVSELEVACPILWEFQVAAHGRETENWLNCYTALADQYVKLGRVDDAEQLESALLARMPWLGGMDSQIQRLGTSIPKLEVIGQLSRMPRAEQQKVANATHAAWSIVDDLRSQLNEMVNEFSVADSVRRQIGVYKRAQLVVDSIVEKYVFSQGIEDEVVSYADFSAGLYDEKKVVASDNGTGTKAQRTTPRDVRVLLRNEILREASYYVNIMDGVIENGIEFLHAQQKQAGREQQSISAKQETHNTAIQAPQGFQSKAEVIEVFGYFLTRAQKLGAKPLEGSRAMKNQGSTQSSKKRVTATRSTFTLIRTVTERFVILVAALMAICAGAVYMQSSTVCKKTKSRQKALNVAAKRRGEEPAGTAMMRFNSRLIAQLEECSDRLIDIISGVQDTITAFSAGIRKVKLQSFISIDRKPPSAPVPSKAEQLPRQSSLSTEKKRKRHSPKSKTFNSGNIEVEATRCDDASTTSSIMQEVAHTTDSTPVTHNATDKLPGFEADLQAGQAQIASVDVNSESNTLETHQADEELEFATDCTSSEQATSGEGSVGAETTDEEEGNHNIPLTADVEMPARIAKQHTQHHAKAKPKPLFKTRERIPSKPDLTLMSTETIITPANSTSAERLSVSGNRNYSNSSSPLTADSVELTEFPSQTPTTVAKIPPPTLSRPHGGSNTQKPAAQGSSMVRVTPNTEPRAANGFNRNNQSRRISRTPSPGVPPSVYLVRHASCPFPTLPDVSNGQTQAPMITQELKFHVLHQIEYYFSIENLCKDLYLRARMDKKGYVRLSEIAKFNRILAFGVSPWVLLEAVLQSTTLEVIVPWAIKACGDQGIHSNKAILDTKIRTRDHPERWVLGSEDDSSPVERVASPSM